MADRIGVYPGTFDPITLGHMDIIKRGARLVDELIIGVTTNITKSPLFEDEERIEMVRREVTSIGGDIRVVGFNSLLMDFADAQGASVVVRGIRGVTDFEYEYQLTGMNRQLNARVDVDHESPSKVAADFLRQGVERKAGVILGVPAVHPVDQRLRKLDETAFGAIAAAEQPARPARPARPVPAAPPAPRARRAFPVCST